MTPFQTASGGSPQAELAMCQRYYILFTDAGTGGILSTTGGIVTATIAQIPFALPVTMRIAPSSIETSNISWYNYGNGTLYNTGTFTLQDSNPNFPLVRYTHGTSVFTAGQIGTLVTTSANGYLAFSAEL